MTQGKPRVLSRADWATHPDLFWKGHVEGHTFGTGVTVLFYTTEEVGVGPKWHVHPYDEIFIIREGRALFTVGDERFECEAGQVFSGRPACRTSSSISARGGWRPPTSI